MSEFRATLIEMLGWPRYRVREHEIDEKKKTLTLLVRRKRATSG
jgi:hypothetical protein